MADAVTFVDVFGEAPLQGNPVAVVHDAGDLDEARMLAVARWFDLSETAFLLPAVHPDADYRVRIFTPARELPFAGHPTLGSGRAWLHAGGRPRTPGRLVQECAAGLVPLRGDGERLAFRAPPLVRFGPVDDDRLAGLRSVLGLEAHEVLDAAWVDNGPGWVALRLASADAVASLTPVRHHADRIDVGVVGAFPPGVGAAYEVRAFFTDQHGVLREDPVTGSFQASVAQWSIASGVVAAPYEARQGRALGRDGRVSVSVDAAGAVWIGGRTHVVVAGTLRV